MVLSPDVKKRLHQYKGNLEQVEGKAVTFNETIAELLNRVGY